MAAGTPVVVLRESVDVNFKILRIMGWWPPEGPSLVNRHAYHVYSFVVLSLTYVMNLITETTKMVLSLNDLEQLSAASFMFLTHFAEVFKLYFFLSRNRGIQRLLDDLKRKSFMPRNKYQEYNVRRLMRQSRNFYIFVLVSCVICVIFLGIYPMLDYMLSDIPMRLPMSMWYPFDTSRSPAFEIVYFYQFFSTMCNAFSVISSDGSYSSFMAHICAQLDNLSDSMQNLREQTLQTLQLKRVDYNDRGLEVDWFQSELNKSLKERIEHHKDILQFAKDLGDQYTFSIMAQFVCGVVILCISLLQLTLVRVNTLQFYFMIIYELCILIEIMLFCYYSNEIIFKSEKLAMAAYKSDWIHCSVPYKKTLLFFMQRTQKPIKLYAGNFFVLSFETYVAILRSSWSYFAVLHKVQEE